VNMVFQFEHMDVDSGPGGKWDVIPFDLVKLKTILTKWQTELHGKGWNSLYWNNHDQPRIVSRLGDDGEYRVKSAKMLATLLHLMQGTPYIYQGEEFGMTNVRFSSIEEYKDIETLNMYREKVAEGMNLEDIMKSIYVKGRDNARTPMQWNSEDQGGFTEGEPWIALNPNYKEINAEQALKDPESIFYYYQKLIALRKEHEIIPYGSFELHYADHPSIYAYTRAYENEKILVLCNVSGEKQVIDNVASFDINQAEILITNEEKHEKDEFTLNPWEATAYYFKG
jgi:oligo-1,6-glucosidase